ncbi:hypothetical protein BJ165DRAFT_1356330, partial [Panaeolus papilionaceus]
CRGCIRKQHLHNPFHKIECWTGNHFRRAALWEVGLYVVAPHQDLQNLFIDPDVRQPSGLMRVAHTNGYHRINFLRCSCQGESKTFGDFVAAGFMPASFSQVNTLFTRQLLDFARLANLELAASVYQIHQLLVRQTQPLGYILADDLYHLLRRMLRLDCWMKKLKWAGFGHLTQDPLKPAAGQLSNFCAACPQPGINLPADWKSDKNQVVYSRSFVADGNFKADHISAATRADETPLYDGGGMMPHSDAYKNHIEKATETRMVSLEGCLG